jgi:hypothetical protein
LTGALSAALTRRSFTPRHDRGQVLCDLAVMPADGGEAIADIAVLRHQSSLLGSVASAPTAWRTLAELSPARLVKIDKARARVRRRVWSLLPQGVPASKVADTDLGDFVVLDVDATVVVAHSEKESAAPTFKGLLHVPARLIHTARRRHLRIPATWPWVNDLVGAFARITAIPSPV